MTESGSKVMAIDTGNRKNFASLIPAPNNLIAIPGTQALALILVEAR